MKIGMSNSRWVLFVFALLICTGCHAAQASSSYDGSAALALKQLVASDPEVKRLLIASIEKARLVNPDPNTNPAQTLEQYLIS